METLARKGLCPRELSMDANLSREISMDLGLTNFISPELKSRDFSMDLSLGKGPPDFSSGNYVHVESDDTLPAESGDVNESTGSAWADHVDRIPGSKSFFASDDSMLYLPPALPPGTSLYRKGLQGSIEDLGIITHPY